MLPPWSYWASWQVPSAFFCSCTSVIKKEKLKNLIANQGHFHKSFSLTVETNGYTLLSSEYPHSELVFNTHTVLANSGYRHQTLPGFITAAASSERPFRNIKLRNSGNKSHISSKQYLFHIYPSHNFW